MTHACRPHRQDRAGAGSISARRSTRSGRTGPAPTPPGPAGARRTRRSPRRRCWERDGQRPSLVPSPPRGVQGAEPVPQGGRTSVSGTAARTKGQAAGPPGMVRVVKSLLHRVGRNRAARSPVSFDTAQNATRRGIMVALTLVALLADRRCLGEVLPGRRQTATCGVFDNGPLVRGPTARPTCRRPSEGFIWVGKDDRPRRANLATGQLRRTFGRETPSASDDDEVFAIRADYVLDVRIHEGDLTPDPSDQAGRPRRAVAFGNGFQSRTPQPGVGQGSSAPRSRQCGRQGPAAG